MKTTESQEKSLLIIDDEENMRHYLRSLLEKKGYLIEEAENGKIGFEKALQSEFTFILCDIRMPVMSGMEFLEKINTTDVRCTLIMMSAYGSVDDAIESMKLGAYDYISKPFKADEILLVLAKAEEREALRLENKKLLSQVSLQDDVTSFNGMVGTSQPMMELFSIARKVARYNSTVLITGESGTGKELVAKGIHQVSGRSDQPFVAINCGSIPESLIESELFGFVKGAFTGADSTKKGLFEEADQGTIFLDEIGELPLAMQVKLLRVLQEQEVRKLGGSRSEKVDVRVVAATARDLEQLAREKTFREDLFFRLNVIHLELPSLRERVEDIPLLCKHFLQKISHKFEVEVPEIAVAAMSILMHHRWPGNVRELENTLERAVILSDTDKVQPESLAGLTGNRNKQRRFDDYQGTYSLKEGKRIMEKRLISKAMKASSGNKSKAAQLLELSYPALLSKLKEYDC